MAGVFGKDPNMKRSGGRQELDRIMGERQRKKAAAAAKFLQKKRLHPSLKRHLHCRNDPWNTEASPHGTSHEFLTQERCALITDEACSPNPVRC